MMVPVVRALSRIFAGRLVIAGLPMAQVVFADVQIERFVPQHLAPERGARAVDINDAAMQIGRANVLVSLTESKMTTPRGWGS